jgi:hypothetical protein
LNLVQSNGLRFNPTDWGSIQGTWGSIRLQSTSRGSIRLQSASNPPLGVQSASNPPPIHLERFNPATWSSILRLGRGSIHLQSTSRGSILRL